MPPEFKEDAPINTQNNEASDNKSVPEQAGPSPENSDTTILMKKLEAERARAQTTTPPPISDPTPPAPQTSRTSKKVPLLIFTLLLIGIIGVGAVYAYKFVFNSSDIDPLITATEEYLSRDAIGASITTNIDTTVEGDVAGLSNVNLTLVIDSLISETDSKFSGSAFTSSMGDISSDASVSFVAHNEDLYLRLDRFDIESLDKLPPEMALLLFFFPIEDLVGTWIHIPRLEKPIDVVGQEYSSLNATSEDLLEKINTFLLDDGWKTFLEAIMVYLPSDSNKDQLVFRTNITRDNIEAFLHAIDPAEVLTHYKTLEESEEELDNFLTFVNSYRFYVDKATHTLSYITLINQNFDTQEMSTKLDITLTPIADLSIDIPENAISLEEAFSGGAGLFVPSTQNDLNMDTFPDEAFGF